MMRRLTVGQRTVVVIAFAVVLWFIWDYLFVPQPGSGGWFGYVPEMARVYAPHARGAEARTFTWAVPAVAWAAVCVWLLSVTADHSARRVAKLRRPQRVVLVVAAGATAVLTAGYLTRPTTFVRQLGADSRVGHLGPELGPFAAWLVGLAFVILWAATSVWAFKDE